MTRRMTRRTTRRATRRATRATTRGYVLLLVMSILAVVAVGGVVAFNRVCEARIAAPADDDRLTLLWLARSAALSGGPAHATVRTKRGAVDVVTTARNGDVTATAAGLHGKAQVDVKLSSTGPVAWRETYDRLP